MIDALKLAISFIRSHAKLLVVAFLAVALISGAVYTKHWYNDQIAASYNRGVKVTDDKWIKIQNKNKEDNQDFKNKQQDAVDKISNQLAEQQAKNAKLEADLAKKQSAYQNSVNGSKKCLDNDYVDIYNESLGLK